MTDPHAPLDEREAELDQRAQQVIAKTKAVSLDRILLLVFLAIQALAFTLGFLVVQSQGDDIADVTKSTNTAVTKTIPALQAQVDQLQKAVNDAAYILTQQAVPAILDYQALLDASGVPHRQVILEASQPPYAQQEGTGP